MSFRQSGATDNSPAVPAPRSEDRRTCDGHLGARWSWSRDNWALAAFVGLIVLGGGYLLLGPPAAGRWFIYDEWRFLVGGSEMSALADHNGHWVTIPFLVYRVLYWLFGVTTYVPYVMTGLIAHVSVIVLVRVVMRRAGVGAWTSTIVAGSLMLFGPGWNTIMWPFQITLTAAMAFGMIQLILADHDGPMDRRDLIGILFGLAAVMSSGVGLVMLAAVGTAALLRRGFRVAIVQTIPLAFIFLLWSVLFDRSPEPEHAAVGALPGWMLQQAGVILEGLLGSVALGAVVWLVAVVGFWLLRAELGSDGLARRAAAPIGLATAVVVMSVLTWWGRGLYSPEINSLRYVYIQVALLLPSLAVGLFAVMQRSAAVAVFLIPLLVLVPLRLPELDPRPFELSLSKHTRELVTGLAASPLTRQVPRWVHPSMNPAVAGAITVGWLLEAGSQGKLPNSPGQAAAEIDHQIRLGLGVASPPAPESDSFTDCEEIPSDAAKTLRPEVGNEFRLRFGANGTVVSLIGSGSEALASNWISSTEPVQGRSAAEGMARQVVLRVNLPDLMLRIEPADGPGTPQSVEFCRLSR